MNELERVAVTLVRSIEAKFPQYLAAPFRAHEIYEQLIPYRSHRAALGVETSEYYELAISRLLAGEGGYLVAPEEVRSALQTELASPNPDSAQFRQFANVDVKLGETALTIRSMMPTPTVVPTVKPAPPTLITKSATPTTRKITPAHRTPDRQQPAPTKKNTQPDSNKEWKMPANQRTTTAVALGGKCRYCHGALPDARDLTYCPHCGQDLTVHHCQACSTELEVGWKFCVTCGRSVES